MDNYAFPGNVSRFGCLARKIDEGPIELNLWPVMSECCAVVHHTYDLMCDDFGFPSSPPAPCAHSIRLWIFPQCLNPFQHKNNTTHPNVFCRLEKKEKNFFHPHRRSHFFPSSTMPARSHLYDIEWIFYVFRSHFIFTLMMGKTPSTEQQHHVEVFRTT